ncbi:MAG: hypothetical protein ACYTE3_31035 [Planctomycetota bacterium]
MKKRTWVKLIVSLLVVGAIAAGLCIRWGPIGRGSDPLAAWGRGNPTLSERTYYSSRINRTYYSSRINRVIQQWAATGRNAGLERDGHFKNSYKTLLVIDLDRQAMWIEENGVVKENDYAEFPPGLKWQFHHATPQGNKELSGRIALKMRGAFTRQKEPEAFFLVGTGRGTGHFNLQFYADGGHGSYNSGPFRPQPFRSRYSGNSENSYGSILVTDSEYARQGADGKIPNAQAGNWLEENEADWLRVEKSLYGQIERHVRNAGYELRSLKVEPGPDFSAGRAEFRGRSDSVLHEIFGGYASIEGYFKFDCLGNDIWYAKSLPRHPQRPLTRRQTLDLEFLVHPTSQIMDSQRSDLLAKGRKLQQPGPTAPSKWKATLASGATVEFIGICENPSAGKQWWGPDGSPVAHVPYVNTEPYGRPRANKKLYEFVWRIENPDRSGATTHWFEGNAGSYYRNVRDRYGYGVIQNLSANGYSFDKSRRRTTWRAGLASGDWQTELVVEDKGGETNFLDKQRIILNPPAIENGQIVVCCFEESASGVRDYQTDFGLIVWEDSASKTISLDRYAEDVSNNSEAGMIERKFTLKDVSMSQIQGVCFRYRPFEFVTFKNISLVPGEDQGFEIELGQ